MSSDRCSSPSPGWCGCLFLLSRGTVSAPCRSFRWTVVFGRLFFQYAASRLPAGGGADQAPRWATLETVWPARVTTTAMRLRSHLILIVLGMLLPVLVLTAVLIVLHHAEM